MVISLSSTSISVSNNVAQQIKQIRLMHDRIVNLYIIKYRILLYGVQAMQIINDIDIPGLNHELLTHLINSSISLNTLVNSFPRFSMLVS